MEDRIEEVRSLQNYNNDLTLIPSLSARRHEEAHPEVIGKPVTILIPPNRMDEKPQIHDRIKRGEKGVHYEAVRRRKDGAEIDISLTVLPVPDKIGKVIGASKIARDITERKQWEEKLRRSEAYLDEGRRLSHTGSWAWNVLTGDLLWSQGHLRIFGLDPEKALPSMASKPNTHPAAHTIAYLTLRSGGAFDVPDPDRVI